MRVFAISDIHGCNQTFRALLRQLHLTPQDHLFLLGDYIDRGPDSRGVLDKILQLQDDGLQVHCLSGNHEQMMLDALADPANLRGWFINGGFETLQSFGVQQVDAIPERYLQLLSDLAPAAASEDYIFVHAGLNMRLDDPFADEQAMLWIRDWYGDLNREWLDGRIIVHGHTPQPRQRTMAALEHLDTHPVLNIDNGCYFGQANDAQGYGSLCAVDLTHRRLYFEKNRDGGW
ncbi:serine/threonine protein phosphatase 1 [Catalinimonas alkaloidigena]|uniref:Serine/threonine protein phosphatase 1 n=1 Tax=Catalinimonas alkaloidigena TaxID=1075417 RepID=A0A1G9HTQ4_9BACT|nr:metallophosphoesterase family protein [Catalinimonas alkaloidigena]SDL16222.1 serine/threonine protein phosphatase 1 [Catalinimonas alkaloidigena]